MEVEKLTTLRKKLVARRRALVESLHKVAQEQLSGDPLATIQSAIEDESRTSSGRAAPRPALAAEPRRL
jgi:hypothetical protein